MRVRRVNWEDRHTREAPLRDVKRNDAGLGEKSSPSSCRDLPYRTSSSTNNSRLLLNVRQVVLKLSRSDLLGEQLVDLGWRALSDLGEDEPRQDRSRDAGSSEEEAGFDAP